MTTTGSIRTDLPTATDTFGAWSYAEAASRVLRRTGSNPLTIGVHGEWGSGKTSLLKMLHLVLQPSSGVIQNPVRLSDDAQNRLSTLYPFAKSADEILDAHRAFIQAYDDWRAVEFDRTDVRRRQAYIVAKERLLALSFSDGDISVDVVWFNAWQFDDDELAWHALLETIRAHISASPWYPTDTQLMDSINKGLRTTVVRGMRIAAAALTAGAIKEFGLEAYLEEAKTRLAAKEQLEKVIGGALSSGRTERHPLKMAIFIDDLDRCSPATVISLLERLKIFFDVHGCLFFLAAAESVIEAGIEAKGSDLGYGGYFAGKGREYLEKIIQLPLRLPQLQVAQISSLLRSLQLEQELENIAVTYAPYISPNPRQIKRLANVFSFLHAYLAARSDGSSVELPSVAYLAVIQFEFPTLYAGLAEHGFELYRLLLKLSHGERAAAAQFTNNTVASFPAEEWAGMSADARRAVILRATDTSTADPMRHCIWEIFQHPPTWRFLIGASPITETQLKIALSLTLTMSEDDASRTPLRNQEV